MSVSAISGLSGYNILGIYGNPSSIRSVSKVDEYARKNNPLVTVAEQPEEAADIQEYEPLEPTTSVDSGGFADILALQDGGAQMQNNTFSQDSGNASSAFNDTIGLMGFQNNLREQLLGADFQPFALA